MTRRKTETETLPANDAPPAEATPLTLEERVALLEAALAEKDRVIAEQAAEKAANVDRIALALDKIADCKGRLVDATEEAKEAKAALSAANEELVKAERKIVGDRKPMPLFDGKPAEATPTEAPATEPEPWRAVLLDTLSLSKLTVSRLFQANICTLGDLVDFTAPSHTGYCHTLNDIPGIGEKSAEEIGDALSEYWQMQAAKDAGSEDADIGEKLSSNGEWEESETVEEEDEWEAYEDEGLEIE